MSLDNPRRWSSMRRRWRLSTDDPGPRPRWWVSGAGARARRLCSWVVPSSDEAATLEEIELPPGFERGTCILALVIAAVGITGSLLNNEDGNDVINVALVLATVLPWVLILAGRELSRLVFAVMVLWPSACLGAVRLVWTNATPSDSSPPRWIGGVAARDAVPSPSFAEHLSVFMILLMLLTCIIGTQTRDTMIATVGAWATVVLQFAAIGDGFSLTVWTLAIALMLLAGVAIRVVVLTIIDARDARAAVAAAEERRRIARDVHDVVAHTLAVTMLHMTAARMAVLRSAPDQAVEALEEAERHGRSSLADVRRVIRVLRSEGETAVDAAQPDLADLPGLVERYRTAGVDIELAVESFADSVPPSVGLAVYRVTQESLANAARHGRGGARVDVRVTDGQVALQVRNPMGRGRSSDGHGTGLAGMKERIAAAGGHLTAGAQNGDWVVDASIPVSEAIG